MGGSARGFEGDGAGVPDEDAGGEFSRVGSARTGAGVVLVDGGRETEAAGEEARGGVDAHDLRWEDVDRGSASGIASMRRFGRPGGRSGSRRCSLFAGKISSPKWPEEGPQPRRSGGIRTTFSGEPMDQSALTDTSRLTATTCDRKRGHAGQLSGITLHIKTRATLGLGAMGNFSSTGGWRPRPGSARSPSWR